MKLHRLRGRKICERVLRKGRVWKGKTMLIRALPGAPRHPGADPEAGVVYIGSIVSSKLNKSAVVRNRMRRRCREAWRTVMKDCEKVAPVQLLIAPRSSSLSAPFADIQGDVRAFLSTLPPWQQNRTDGPASSSSS